MRNWGKGLGADLSEEGDWLLAHGMSVTNVGFNDLDKGLLHSLRNINTIHGNIRKHVKKMSTPRHLFLLGRNIANSSIKFSVCQLAKLVMNPRCTQITLT